MCPKFIEHACLRPIQHTVHSHYLSPNWSNTGFDPTKPIVMSVCVSITYVCTRDDELVLSHVSHWTGEMMVERGGARETH